MEYRWFKGFNVSGFAYEVKAPDEYTAAGYWAGWCKDPGASVPWVRRLEAEDSDTVPDDEATQLEAMARFRADNQAKLDASLAEHLAREAAASA